jgi:hypothetical protein
MCGEAVTSVSEELATFIFRADVKNFTEGLLRRRYFTPKVLVTTYKPLDFI